MAGSPVDLSEPTGISDTESGWPDRNRPDRAEESLNYRAIDVVRYSAFYGILRGPSRGSANTTDTVQFGFVHGDHDKFASIDRLE